MREVRIDTQDCSWIYDTDEWKYYCGVCGEDFDEIFVIHGNRDYDGVEKASWYEKARNLMHDFDESYGDDDFRDYYKNEYNDEQWSKLCKIYDDCRVSDSDETIIKVLGVLYPERKFKTGTIRGSAQREWQEVLYDADKCENIGPLGEVYFGEVAEIYAEDDDGCTCVAIVRDDELWQANRKGELKKLICELLGFSEDEDFEVYESDGYIQQTKWKKVEV